MKWISVKDENPEINEKTLNSSDVLVFDSSGTQYVGYLIFYPIAGYRKKEEYKWSDRSTGCGCCSENLDVTHWMPLPESPEKCRCHVCNMRSEDNPYEFVCDLVMEDHERKLEEREKSLAENPEKR